MKHIFYLLFSIVIFASCSTIEKFCVSGAPGTEIYAPSGQRLATINQEGVANVSVSGDDFYAFLVSKSPNSDMIVPFALDYKNKSYIGTRILDVSGIVVTSLGLASVLMSFAADEESGQTALMCGGFGTTGLGLAMGIPADTKLRDKTRDYQFTYLSHQRTNNDILFTPAVIDEPYKTKTVETVETEADDIPSMQSTTSLSTKHLTQKSTKTLKDYGKQTEGVYVGEGSLTQGNDIIEQYSDIRVSIVRVSSNTVEVSVTEADGSDFFETPSEYTIIKNNNGDYVLTHKSIKDAVIVIHNNTIMQYTHSKVNIDGGVYKLSISGNKE